MSTFTTEIDVRFRDIDAMGHVNNAVYATYVEQARTAHFREVSDLSLDEMPTVLASLSIDFRAPVELGDGPVTVELEIPELGQSSIPMEYTLRTEEGIVAEATSVQVIIDPETGKSTSMPDNLREQISEYYGL